MKGLARRVEALEGPSLAYLTLGEVLDRLDDHRALPGKVCDPRIAEALSKLGNDG